MNEDNFEYTEDLNAQAENGDQDAQFAIAMCFDHGYGIVKDPFEAIPWYKKLQSKATLMHSSGLGNYMEITNKKTKLNHGISRLLKRGIEKLCTLWEDFFH